ncbi:hypothetical protein [Bacillus infantis]|uniref:hypothetical protein n=1 Tax=Bacillus infantis TaxID=324767 RepID=UPI003CEC0C9B
MYELGDIVRTNGTIGTLFEVIHIEGETIWIADGHVQTRRTPVELKLVCKAENRIDQKVPRIKYWK